MKNIIEKDQPFCLLHPFFDKKNLGNNFQQDYQKAVDNFNETVKKYKAQCNTPQKIDHWLNCKTIKFNPYEY